MSATSISFRNQSFENNYEDSKLPDFEDSELPDFEDSNETTGPRKTSHRKPLLIMSLVILGLTLIIAFTIDATTSTKEAKFFSKSTLFYNMTVPPTKLITSTSETSFCGDLGWIADGQCDDESNKVECLYDGGDCCLQNSTLTFCIKCICHLTGHRHNYNDHDEITKEERALVVIGGKIYESATEDSTTEVIYESKDFANQFFATYPDNRIGTCGGLVGDLIMVCGGKEEYHFGYNDFEPGSTSNECYYFSPLDNKWILIHNMNKARTFAASIVVDGKLWITGGEYWEVNYFGFKSSSEFVDQNTFLEGPDMPYDFYISQHCLTRLNSHQVMLIGGQTSISYNKQIEHAETFIYDFSIDDNTWTTGPEMSIPRAGHGCATFTDEEGFNWTIAFGGVWPYNFYYDLYGDDGELTEILRENSSKWTSVVSNNPLLFHDMKLINFMDRVILIGGSGDESRLSGTNMFELVKSTNGQFEWILSDLSLKYPRTTFTVLDVPISSIKPN